MALVVEGNGEGRRGTTGREGTTTGPSLVDAGGRGEEGRERIDRVMDLYKVRQLLDKINP